MAKRIVVFEVHSPLFLIRELQQFLLYVLAPLKRSGIARENGEGDQRGLREQVWFA